jgi:hypothetical protein
MDDLKKFKEESKKPGDLAKSFYSFISFNPITTKQHIFSVEKEY